MNSKTISWTIFAVVVIALLIILAPHSGTTPEVLPDGETQGFVPEKVEAIHSFRDGTHTLFGSIDLPTPCYTLSTDVIVAESFPEQVTIDFKAEVDPDIMCTQVISPSEFSVEVDVSEDATFSTRFNGVSVPLEIKE